MGYTLTIGEAEIEWNEDLCSIEAKGVSLDSAPAFGEPTDRTNSRWPSYTSWREFCEAVEIEQVMFGENGGEIKYGDGYLFPLIQGHPGASPIVEGHYQYIRDRVELYKKEHPAHRAEYKPLKPGVKKSAFNFKEDYVDDPECDGWLVRAEWLLFWLRWALDNCEKPVFVNS